MKLPRRSFLHLTAGAAALREMRRVLNHGGRLALSIWNSIGLYNAAVGEALVRFVGNVAATKFCASRQVPAKEDLPWSIC